MNLTEESDISKLLQYWEDCVDRNEDPVPVLTRIAEVIETQSMYYWKTDPDPFDQRRPSRSDPNCAFLQMLKTVFRNKDFVDALINDYLNVEDDSYAVLGISRQEVRTATCRILLDILPGTETSELFEAPQHTTLVTCLYEWAEKEEEPLRTYATGLLPASFTVLDPAATRELNNRLIPIMIDRLRDLYNEHCREVDEHRGVNRTKIKKQNVNKEPSYNGLKDNIRLNGELPSGGSKQGSPSGQKGVREKKRKLESERGHSLVANKKICVGTDSKEDSASSTWADMETYVLPCFRMHPLSRTTSQIFILSYLAPLGEYQEYLSHIVEKDVVQLIFQLIDRKYWQGGRLAFEALCYLSSILCHKKFAIEFVKSGRLEKLLEVPRPGIAATAISICLLYLSYCEDAMEYCMCVLPPSTISKLTNYALWLLECSHDSGRCRAAMFFGLCFQFGKILDEFDAQDGLRKMFNVVTRLPIFFLNDGEHRNEEEEYSARQIVRHVCTALKKYMEAHLHRKADSIQAAYSKDLGHNIVQPPFSPNKAYKSTPEMIREQINLVSEYLCLKPNWKPVNQHIEFSGVNLMCRIIAANYDWNNSGRAETVRSALDVIGICAVSSKALAELTDTFVVMDGSLATGFQIILSAAENEVVVDSDVQKSALNVLITAACAPLYKEGEMVRLFRSNSRVIKKKCYKVSHSIEETVHSVWECIRKSNGIMVLMTLLTTKSPITEADDIRLLAVQVLNGLARSETVKQIISKLPLFTELHNLMKEPVLQEKRREHVTFQKYALMLLSRICDSRTSGYDLITSRSRLQKANVVAQTKIQFNEKQLFQIIHQHLVKHGMIETANALQKEANLSPSKLPQPSITHSPLVLNPLRQNWSSNVSKPETEKEIRPSNTQSCSFASPDESVCSSPANTSASNHNTLGPIKWTITKPHEPKSVFTPNRYLQRTSRLTDHLLQTFNDVSPPECNVTLDSIITEYLLNQHASCSYPMITCPPFDLLRPHRCPKPKKLRYRNCAVRYATGMRMRRMDEHLIHSRFCPVRTFKMDVVDDDLYYTVVKFLNNEQIVVGTYEGNLKILNVATGTVGPCTISHSSYIINLAVNSTGSLVVSSSSWRRPLSKLWSYREGSTEFMLEHSFEDEDYFEFSKLNDQRLLGTRGENAVIYDVETKERILTMYPDHSNRYSKNRATFNPTDSLVLSDGVLWDVNSGKEIHKFDKLNQSLNGVFHPNGLEIISNTEVWDVRTYHLLKTVPLLDQCNVIFPRHGYVLYAVAIDKEENEQSGFDTAFKTLDAYDYSSIATIDVRKPIFDLACNRSDMQIAIVENQGQYDNVEESSVRIYDVGRWKEEDNADDDDGEDNDDDGSDSGDTSISSSTAMDNDNDDNDEHLSDDVSLSSFDISSPGSSISDDFQDDDDPDFVLHEV